MTAVYRDCNPPRIPRVCPSVGMTDAVFPMTSWNQRNASRFRLACDHLLISPPPSATVCPCDILRSTWTLPNITITTCFLLSLLIFTHFGLSKHKGTHDEQVTTVSPWFKPINTIWQISETHCPLSIPTPMRPRTSLTLPKTTIVRCIFGQF